MVISRAKVVAEAALTLCMAIFAALTALHNAAHEYIRSLRCSTEP